MPKYATLVWRQAALSSEFGLKWAIELFGDEAIASLPVLKTGKNKGQRKGFVHWRKAATSGYCRETGHGVKVGQFVDAWIGEGHFTARDNAMQGQWLGRVQSLAASASAGAFFREGRDRHAAEMARWEADRRAEAEEMGR